MHAVQACTRINGDPQIPLSGPPTTMTPPAAEVSGAERQQRSDNDDGMAAADRRTVMKQKLREYREILRKLERDKAVWEDERTRLSRITQRHNDTNATAPITCHVCNHELTNATKTSRLVQCSGCQQLICRQCAVRFPSPEASAPDTWSCKLCNSFLKGSHTVCDWLLQQLNERFANLPANTGRAASRDGAPGGTQTNGGSIEWNESEKTLVVPTEQRDVVREYLEELVATMLNDGSLDNSPIGQISSSPLYLKLFSDYHLLLSSAFNTVQQSIHLTLRLPQPENATNLDDSFADLKNMVERIIEQVFKIPDMLDYSGTSRPPTPTQPAFNPQKYEDLLATAVLNKIVEKFEKEQSILRQRRGSSGLTYNDWSARRKRNLNNILHSDSSDEPRSESSHLQQIRNRQMALNLKEQQGFDDSGLPLDTTPGSPTSDEEYLSDYIQNHRVPLPQLNPDDVTINGQLVDDEFPSIASNGTGDSDWQENWMFKKRAQLSENEIPNTLTNSVGMLVPSPTEEVKALIGDKTADEVSDLSEAGSDGESELSEGEDHPSTDLPHALLNGKSTIGGKNESVESVFQPHIEQQQPSSLVSAQSQTKESSPRILEAKNELILVTDISQIELSDQEFDHHSLDAIADGTYGSLDSQKIVNETPKIVGVTPSLLSQNPAANEATKPEDTSNLTPVPTPSHYSPVPPSETHHSPLSPKTSQFMTDQHELIVELGAPATISTAEIQFVLEESHPVIVDSPLPELPSLHTHPLLGQASLSNHFQRSLGLTDNLRRTLELSSPSSSADATTDQIMFHAHQPVNPTNTSNHHSTVELAEGVTTEPSVQQHEEYICRVSPTEYDLSLDDAISTSTDASESAASEVVGQIVTVDENTVPKGIAICSKSALVAMDLATNSEVDVQVGIADTSSGFVSSASEANSFVSETVDDVNVIGMGPASQQELSNLELIVTYDEIKQLSEDAVNVQDAENILIEPTIELLVSKPGTEVQENNPVQLTDNDSVQAITTDVLGTHELSNLELIVTYDEIKQHSEDTVNVQEAEIILVEPTIGLLVSEPRTEVQEINPVQLNVNDSVEAITTEVLGTQELSNLELIVNYEEIQNQIENPVDTEVAATQEISNLELIVNIEDNQTHIEKNQNVSTQITNPEVAGTQEISNLELIVTYDEIKNQIEESQPENTNLEVTNWQQTVIQPEVTNVAAGTQEISNSELIVTYDEIKKQIEENQYENTDLEVTNIIQPAVIQPEVTNAAAGTQELSNLELIVSYDEIKKQIDETQVDDLAVPVVEAISLVNDPQTKEITIPDITSQNLGNEDGIEAVSQNEEITSQKTASPEVFILNVKAEADVEWLPQEHVVTSSEESVSIPTLVVSAAAEPPASDEIGSKQIVFQDSLEIPEIDSRENYDDLMKPAATEEPISSSIQDQAPDSDISDFVVVSEQEQHALQLEENATRDTSVLLPLLTTLSTDIRTSNPTISNTTNTPNLVDLSTAETVIATPAPVEVVDDEDELSVVLRPRNENGDILGSIAEREHNKWKHAEEMPNNPYTPEALQHRLSNASLTRTSDVERLAALGQSAEVQQPNSEHVGVLEKPDITRYGRDYYINESKTAAGKRSSYDDWSSSSPSTPVDQPHNSIADSDLYTARPVLIRPNSVDDLSPQIDSSLTYSEDSDSTRIYDLTNRETSILRNAIIRTSRLPVKEPKQTRTPSATTSDTPAAAAVSRSASFADSEKPTNFEQLDKFRRAIEQPQDAPIILSTTLHAKQSPRLQQFSVAPKAKLLATFPLAKMEETQQQPDEATHQPEVAVSQNSVEMDVDVPEEVPVVPIAQPRAAVPQVELYIPPRFEHEEMVSYNEPVIVSKAVIEEDVLPALPSVRALAKSFVDLQATVDDAPINRPKSLNWQTHNTFDTSKPVSPSDTFPFYNQGYHPVAPGHSITARNLSTQFRDELRITGGSEPNLSAGRASPDRPPSPVLVPGILKNNIAFFENLNTKH